VEDYKFLSRLDALLDMLQATDELDSSDDLPAMRFRRSAKHVYPVRQFIFKCCRRGVCDSADFC